MDQVRVLVMKGMYDYDNIAWTLESNGSSGRKIIQILKKNPKKEPSKYDDDDINHMRRVAAYNKRHLAQEETAKKDTNSRSYKSLKNWGHDAQKSK